jgi:exodeoxyribonuclease VII large subunit
MGNTYLTVPFSQKDKAKALGARWDTAQRQWYVPSGLELAPFQPWLPAGQMGGVAGASTSRDLVTAAETLPAEKPAGVSLSQLLAEVERAVAEAYQQSVWTRVDVVNVNLNVRNKHVYLELSERDEDGNVVAQARGTIWARTAERILPLFERETGAQLAPGIKLLVLAKPVFKAQYGLSLDITGIDASYTIGDLEAQKRRIREQLKAEGLFDRNRKLAAPWDFTRVMVVAPQGAAGLGDFAAEADRLHARGVCEFVYVHSRFQGAGAPADILSAVNAGLQQASRAALDALIIIRGGGALNDLAWLNDYELAKFICLCRVPVLTGIGHERDSTVLDEVAHRSFDTPSKVIAAVEQQVAQRAGDARNAFETVVLHASRAAERSRIASERLETEVRTLARSTVTTAKSETQSAMNQVQLAALGQVHEARQVSELSVRDVQEEARSHLQQAKHEVPAALSSVKELSTAAVRAARSDVQGMLPSVLEQSSVQARRAAQHLEVARETLLERTGLTVKTARTSSDALIREVTGQGPKKTLARGFAVVRSKSGKTVTSAKAAKAAGTMEVTFNDGAVQASVHGDISNKEGG